MKPMFYSLFALCFLMPTYAQTVDFIKELEPAILQCTYRCTMKLDTLGTNTKTDRMILRIGKNISQFYSYTAYRTDSIWKTSNGNGFGAMPWYVPSVRKTMPKCPMPTW